CVATERWRRRSRFRIAARQTKPRSHDADRTIDAWHAGEGLEQSSLEHLRMLEHGGEGENPPRPEAGFFEERGPHPRPSRRKRALELRLQFETVALAILAADKALIADESLAADQAT